MRLETMLKTWFTDDESALSVRRNFDFVRARHEDFLEWGKDLDRRFSEISSADDLSLATAKIDRSNLELLAKVSDLATLEDVFVTSLLPIDAGLSEVGQELSFPKDLCEDKVKPSIERSIDQVKNLRFSLARLRTYVYLAAEKRASLLASIHASHRIRLFRAHATATTDKLEAFLARLDASLQADTLLQRIHTWWVQAGLAKGVGRGTVQNLQFKEALRVLYADLNVAYGFEHEVQALSSALDESVRKLVRDEVQVYREEIQGTIKNLENSGWQSVLAKQKAMTQRRRQLLERYTPTCKEALDLHDQVSLQIKSIDDMALAEDAYLQQLKA